MDRTEAVTAAIIGLHWEPDPRNYAGGSRYMDLLDENENTIGWYNTTPDRLGRFSSVLLAGETRHFKSRDEARDWLIDTAAKRRCEV